MGIAFATRVVVPQSCPLWLLVTSIGLRMCNSSGLRWDGDLQGDLVWVLEVQDVSIGRRLCRRVIHAALGELLLPRGELVDGGGLESQVVQPGAGGVEGVTAADVVLPEPQQRSAVWQGSDREPHTVGLALE